MKFRSPRARKLRSRRVPEGRAGISEFSWRCLNDQVTEGQAEAEGMGWAHLELDSDRTFLDAAPEKKCGAELWPNFSEEIVATWAKEKPGRRPRWWWRLDAPEPALRARVGGVGMAFHEFYEWDGIRGHIRTPLIELGIPGHWITVDEVRWLSEESRPRDNAVPIDPDDLPLFEAQASYLARLGLLMPGEEKRLKEADFEPERLPLDMITCEYKAKRIGWLRERLWSGREWPEWPPALS